MKNVNEKTEGARESMSKDTSTRMNFFSRLSGAKKHGNVGCLSAKKRLDLYTNLADEAFDEEENR